MAALKSISISAVVRPNAIRFSNSYAAMLDRVARENREAEQAAAAPVERLLAAATAPRDAEITALAHRDVNPAAMGKLLDIVSPFTTTWGCALVDIFLPHQTPGMQAYNAGMFFGCWQRNNVNHIVAEPFKKLKARNDINARLARYALGDLRGWRDADAPARAVMVLRKLIPAGIEARRNG